MTDQPQSPPPDQDWLESEVAGERVRVHVPMKVPPWILLGGGKQTLAMEVDGEAKILSVNVPPSSQPGQILRLRRVFFGQQQVDLYIELKGIAINPQVLVVAAAAIVGVVVMLVTLLLGGCSGATLQMGGGDDDDTWGAGDDDVAVGDDDDAADDDSFDEISTPWDDTSTAMELPAWAIARLSDDPTTRTVAPLPDWAIGRLGVVDETGTLMPLPGWAIDHLRRGDDAPPAVPLPTCAIVLLHPDDPDAIPPLPDAAITHFPGEGGGGRCRLLTFNLFSKKIKC